MKLKINSVTKGKVRLPIDFGKSLSGISGNHLINILEQYNDVADMRLSIEAHPQMHESLHKMIKEDNYSQKVVQWLKTNNRSLL